jgi:hypothetical protein
MKGSDTMSGDNARRSRAGKQLLKAADERSAYSMLNTATSLVPGRYCPTGTSFLPSSTQPMMIVQFFFSLSFSGVILRRSFCSILIELPPAQNLWIKFAILFPVVKSGADRGQTADLKAFMVC